MCEGRPDPVAAPLSPVRISRLASELRMLRIRLSAYRRSPPWPGEDHTFRSELVPYDS